MTNTQSTIWKSSIFVSLSQFSRLLTNFLIFIVIARFYGIEQLGQFSLAFTIANLCLVLADFGFDVLITTEVAISTKDSNEIIKKYFTMKMFFMGISSIVMIAIPTFQHFSEMSTLLIYILIPYILFTSFTNFLYAVFRGFEKFEYETKITIITNTFLLLMIMIFGYFKQSLPILVIVFIFARFISMTLGVVKVLALFNHNIFVISFKDWKNTLSKVFVFGFHFLFGNLFFMLDTVLLGVWENDEAVGLYQSAFKLMILLLIIPEILRSSVLPLTSRLFKYEEKNWELVNKLLVKIFLFLAIPVSISLFFFAEQIIFIIYGQGEFENAVPILKLFSIIIFVRFYVESYALMITTSNRQYLRMIIVIAATFLSFILNYFLIPKYGIHGAAYSALIVNVLVGAGYIIVNSKYFIHWTFEKGILLIILSGSLFSYLLYSYQQNYFIFLMFIIIYSISLYYFGFSKTEKKMFSKYFLNTL